MIQGSKTMAFRWIGKKSGPAYMGGLRMFYPGPWGNAGAQGNRKDFLINVLANRPHQLDLEPGGKFPFSVTNICKCERGEIGFRSLAIAERSTF